MPQDIPLEASDVLVFTPESLKDIDGAPSFTLRAVGRREDRFLRRLYREEGVHRHDTHAIRAEVMRGLAALWTEEDLEKHAPMLREYWDASDQHAEAQKEDPEAKFEFDKDIEAGIGELVQNVTQAWPPLRRLFADNADFHEMSMVLLGAVVIKSWTGLDTKRVLNGGFVTVPCMEDVIEDLGRFELKHGLPKGLAWTELAIECGRRMKLDEAEVGNSASPSPSSENPEPSTEKKQKGSSGKSRASASSSKTPEAA